MKKVLKLLIKKSIICIVIIMIIISSITPISYAYTVEEVGSAVGGFAKHVVDEYGKNGKDTVKYRQIVGDEFDNPSARGGESGHCRTDNPIWNTSYSWNDSFIYFDCTSFATGCYNYVTGLIAQPYATGTLVPSVPGDMQSDFEKITWDKTEGSLKVGDLLCYDGHGWIYSGNGQTSENGSFHSNWDNYNNKGTIYIYRVTEEGAKNITNLNTEFSSVKVSASTGKAIDYSNFYFNGIPDGKYSLATRKSIFSLLIDAFKELIDLWVGLQSYLFRGLIIGIISVFDRLLNDTIKSVSDAPETISDTPKDLEEAGITATSADDPYSLNRSITIESLVFNEMDLFDINIFQVD